MKTSEFAYHCQDLLSPFGEITLKAMFGGYGVYCDGLIVGIIAYEKLFLKANKDTKNFFEENGSNPFSYEKNGKVFEMSYYELPEEAHSNKELLEQAVRNAQKAALAAKKK